MNTQGKCPAIRVVMLPKDTNGTGTNIFGGVILSHMDLAGGIAAREVTDHRIVTVSFDQVVFKQPVHIGDVLTCWAEVTRIGRTSITTHILVEVQRKKEFISVTEGEAVYVAVDDAGHPIPVDQPAPSQPTDSIAPACTSCLRHIPSVTQQTSKFSLESFWNSLLRRRKGR